MGPFELGDWHEDKVCVFDQSTDMAVAWLHCAQGRELSVEFLSLVKAAPELLASLKVLVEYLQEESDSGINQDLTFACAKAVTAICRAEGRAE